MFLTVSLSKLEIKTVFNFFIPSADGECTLDEGNK